METCHYETVETLDREDGDSTITRKYLLRQILVCSGIWVAYFCVGLSFGSPTVFIPQLRREANLSAAISIEMESWLSSTYNCSAIVSSVILAVGARLIGRKLSFLITSITALTGYTIFYFSKTVTQILISEVILGPLMASPVTISVMVVTEYTSPRYRGVFLTLKSASLLWGIWVANAIGTFLHWKNIGILACMCSTYTLLTCLLWPESPYFLASKNNLKECAASHRWLKGCSRDSEEELIILIESRRKVQSASSTINVFKKTRQMFTNKIFYKPVILAMIVVLSYHFAGKIACAMYAIDIFKRITGTESTAYTGMLILDGVTVLGMCVGCGLSKILKRRTLLLVSSTIGVTFLFCISSYLYLIHFGIILENTIISISLLMGYSLSISVGPMIMSSTIMNELIPIKYRSSAILLIGCFANFIMCSIFKMTPYILKYTGARGLFLFFSVSESFLTVINYKVLPETKDKTIIEIQGTLLGIESNIKSTDCRREAD